MEALPYHLREGLHEDASRHFRYFYLKTSVPFEGPAARFKCKGTVDWFVTAALQHEHQQPLLVDFCANARVLTSLSLLCVDGGEPF